MKKFLLIFSLLTLTLMLFSDTIVDYTSVYGTWNEAGSPYIVTNDIEIPQGASLTIEPGVLVLVNPNIRIYAYGNIFTNGVEDNLVYIQGINQNSVWNGIEVNSEGSNFTYTNIIGSGKGVILNKTNYISHCNIIGYGTGDFEQGLFIGNGNESEITYTDIFGYMTGVNIKIDTDGDGDDDDGEPHAPTTPTMDVIRIYYSPESWKGPRTVTTTGISMDTKVEPTLTNIDIENYDEGITIKADADGDGDDDSGEPHAPTTPTMDVIRIYYSPESWKSDRTTSTKGIVVEGEVNPIFTNIDIENYDEGITIKVDADGDGDDDSGEPHAPTTPTMDVIRIYYSPESWKSDRTTSTKAIVVDGKINPTLANIDIENYDEGITIKVDADGDGDDDSGEPHAPTTPTMDVIRIYYSPESWKSDRTTSTKAIVVDGKINPTLANIDIENYDEGITIKVDADGDGDDDSGEPHAPTTPTMDVIRIYYSPESWKSDRSSSTKAIVVDGKINPTLANIDIENYDEGITIKVDADGDGDDDSGEPHAPTTPTMDVIRIYYSPESWKSDRLFSTNGIQIEGNISLTGSNIEVENYDTGFEFNCEGDQVLNNISIPNNIPSWNNYGIKSKGNMSLNVDTVNIQNYDNAIYFKSGSTPVQANILNAVISNYNNDRANTKAIYFKGAVNLFVDNSHITDYDNSIYLKNNYNCNVEAKVEHTEIYQTEARRGNFKGIDFTGKINAIINNNVVKSCDPAVSVSGTNSVSDINRNLIFITYHKNNSKGIDVTNIDNNIMKHNTIVNYDKGLASRYTPSELVNNIIWKENPGNNLVSNYDYIEARYNNISLPNGEVFPGISNYNESPDFVGSVDDDAEKTTFAEKFVEFQLNPTSPCIDAGDPVETPDSDGTIPDLGVFEFVGNKDLIESINSEISLKNYPNPFNPTTNILFNVAEEGLVDIKVYNIKGQVVKSLLNEKRTVGGHRVVWNGDNNRGLKVASGVYFVRLKQENNQITRKILLTK